MFGELQIDRENFQLTTFDRKTFLEKYQEVWQALNRVRSEIEIAFGDQDISITELIGGALQTFLIRDTRGKLAAWAAIHSDFSENENNFYGVSAFFVFSKFRRKGIATFLAQKTIEFCWESNEVLTAQFDVKWGVEFSEEVLQKACRKIGVEWSNVQEIGGGLATEIDSFRIPSKN